MKLKRMTLPKLGALLIAFLCIGATACFAQTPEWIPKPSLVSKLGKPQHYDGFSLRVPAGMTVVFKSVHSSDDGNMTVYIWNHKPKKEPFQGIALTLFDKALPQTPEQAASDWVDQTVSRNISDVTQSDTESGTIDGIGFARIYFKGPERKSGKVVHGFVYVGITEGRTYIFESVDYEPGNTVSLPLNEAAVLTLHETQ